MRLNEFLSYKGDNPAERVEIFVDNSNLHYSLADECSRSDIDYLKLAEKLSAGRTLVRVNLYVGLVNSRRDPDATKQQWDFILALEGGKH